VITPSEWVIARFKEPSRGGRGKRLKGHPNRWVQKGRKQDGLRSGRANDIGVATTENDRGKIGWFYRGCAGNGANDLRKGQRD